MATTSSSSSSFLDNPVLKVSRPVAACSKCRSAKIRCDGKLPACSACERSGNAKNCSGATDEFAKGKERSYVASLEGYCERLEKRLREVKQQKESLALAGNGALQGSVTSISATESGEQAHLKEVSDIDDLVGDFGFLSVSATSRDFKGISSNVSFAQLLLTISTETPLPEFTSLKLPTRYEATNLIRYYFDNIYTQLPFFPETSFWTSMEAVYQDNGRFAKPFDHWILRMVLATSLASSSGRMGDIGQRSLKLIAAALDYAEEVLRPGSVLGIQAVMLLAQYALVNPEYFRARYLVSLAARVMVDLGLHQDPPAESRTDTDRLDQRRRVFWCIYSLDRVVSSATGYTFSFSDDSINVALPYLPPNPMPETLTIGNQGFLKSLEPALHLIDIRRIFTSGYQEMYFHGHDRSPNPLVLTWTLCARAREWYDRAPKHIPQYFSVLYRLEMLYSTIVFLSPSHRDPYICDFSKVLLFDRCLDYVSQLHQIIENPNVLPFANWVDIQRLSRVGKRLIEILNQSYDLLLSNTIPEPPLVPAGTPDPPSIWPEDRISCLTRAIRCLNYTRELLQYAQQRWNRRYLLEEFNRESAAITQRLLQTQEQTSPRTQFVGISNGNTSPHQPVMRYGSVGQPVNATMIPGGLMSASVNGYQNYDSEYGASRGLY